MPLYQLFNERLLDVVVVGGLGHGLCSLRACDSSDECTTNKWTPTRCTAIRRTSLSTSVTRSYRSCNRLATTQFMLYLAARRDTCVTNKALTRGNPSNNGLVDRASGLLDEELRVRFQLAWHRHTTPMSAREETRRRCRRKRTLKDTFMALGHHSDDTRPSIFGTGRSSRFSVVAPPCDWILCTA